MNDGPPTLHPSATQLWQYAQAFNSIAMLSARLRARMSQTRHAAGRLAFSDAEHAARLHEARQLPPIRLMSDQERTDWQQRVPRSLAAPPHDEPVAVWTAQLADSRGNTTGQWGLEAHARDSQGRDAELFLVCRDASDALALTRHLREHGTTNHLRTLQDLALAKQRPAERPSAPQIGRRTAPLLSEADWAAALRHELPADLAARIIVTDPAHPHHTAWRELHHLASSEVERVAADPARLAALVRSVPRWRAGVRNPPALAHWALVEARASGTYLDTVRADPKPSPPAAALAPATHAPPPLREVRDPAQAHQWAHGLDARNPQHRVEAKAGLGRWGSTVDALLATKFPGLIDETATAARRNQPTDQPAHDTTVDQATLSELTAEVDRLDPAKPIDRRAAYLMLGRVPLDIDRLLAAKFGHDARFAQRLQQIHPDGLPEAAPTTPPPAGKATTHTATTQPEPDTGRPIPHAGHQPRTTTKHAPETSRRRS